jgi:hypothetical protein
MITRLHKPQTRQTIQLPRIIAFQTFYPPPYSSRSLLIITPTSLSCLHKSRILLLTPPQILAVAVAVAVAAALIFHAWLWR